MTASTIIDPSTDTNNEELVRLSRIYNLPTIVKQADINEAMRPPESLRSPNVYGDPKRLKFACHSAAATLLSAVYFHDKSAEYHTKERGLVQERLEKAADYFRVRPAYDDIVKQAATRNAGNSLPDSSYAYVVTYDDGATERFYPMTDAASVKVAATWLHSVKDRMPYAERNTISGKILDKAASYGAGLGRELDDFLEKQAGRGIPEPGDIHDMLLQRAAMCSRLSPDWRVAVEKMAETVLATPQIAMQSASLIKLASTVEELDHVLGIRGKYTSTIRRPEDVIFGLTLQKAAGDYASLCVLQTGKVFDKNQFDKVARADVESLFGTDFVEAVSTGLDIDTEKFAAVASTLPRNDAEMLESLMQAAGQHPQSFKTAAFSGLPADALEHAAAMYQKTQKG